MPAMSVTSGCGEDICYFGFFISLCPWIWVLLILVNRIQLVGQKCGLHYTALCRAMNRSLAVWGRQEISLWWYLSAVTQMEKNTSTSSDNCPPPVIHAFCDDFYYPYHVMNYYPAYCLKQLVTQIPISWPSYWQSTNYISTHTDSQDMLSCLGGSNYRTMHVSQKIKGPVLVQRVEFQFLWSVTSLTSGLMATWDQDDMPKKH